MKKFTLIVALFVGMTAMATTFEGNLGPPGDPIEQTTFADVLEQSNDLFINGWDVMEVQSFRIQESEFAMLLRYERPVPLSDLKEELVFVTKPIANFTLLDYHDTKVTILTLFKKPKVDGKWNQSIQSRWKSGNQMGSAGGLPYTHAGRVVHV